MFKILYQDDDLIAIDKPAGFYVHPPENRAITIPREENCLRRLREQSGKWLYPVHRLDRATSGVLVYALSTEAASSLAQAFSARAVTKKYWAVVRGYLPEAASGAVGIIDRPLKRDSSDTLAEARTTYRTLAQLELPHAVGRHASTRYSFLEVEPLTGRFHQIRRHLAGTGHPLIGDTVHGDGKHNRFFRQEIGLSGLLLKAYELRLPHPRTARELRIESPGIEAWQPRLGVLPWKICQSSPLGAKVKPPS
ncbi:MAG: pseudouridine synthase [Bacteriovoracia bacterium]